MDLVKERLELKEYRKIINELEQELEKVNLLLKHSTKLTYHILILRNIDVQKQII